MIYRSKESVVLLFWFLLILNAMKPVLDYYVSISSQVVSFVQILLLLIFVTIFNKNFYRTINLKAAALLFFVLIKLLYDILILMVEGASIFDIVSPIYFVIRFVILVYLFQYLVCKKESIKTYLTLRNILLWYFVLTVVYSIMQNKFFFDVAWIREYGGNIMSSNSLGAHRVNGAIGGTVITYSNFLLAIAWVLFFTKFKSINVKIFLIVLFIFAVYLNFSRSLLLALFIMSALSFKLKYVWIYLIPVMVTIFFWKDLVGLFSTISDVRRVDNWNELFVDFSMIDYLLGTHLGANTGLFVFKGEKISGDGFIFGLVYDIGIIGLALFLIFIGRVVNSVNINLSSKISIGLTFLLMLFVNSGFEKIFILAIYLFSIVIVKNLCEYSQKEEEAI
jgi:hypothetical protein